MSKKNVEITSFDDWFSGSHIRNPDGTPLIAFHGTQNKFETFRVPAWFTPNEFYADCFSADWGEEGERTPDSRVLPVYLSFKNPLYTNDWAMTEPGDTEEWLQGILEKGYDSVIFSREGEVEFIAFQADQIMLASDPVAPNGEFKEYQGTDEGRKFKGRRQPSLNDLFFVKLSPWIELEDGKYVRTMVGEDPSNEDAHIAIAEMSPKVLLNSDWINLANEDIKDIETAKSLCDVFLKTNGAVLEQNISLRRKNSPK